MNRAQRDLIARTWSGTWQGVLTVGAVCTIAAVCLGAGYILVTQPLIAANMTVGAIIIGWIGRFLWLGR